MKKFLFLSFLAIGTLSFSSNFSANKSKNANTNSMECKNGQCNGTAQSTGLRCRSCIPNEGGYYCANHDWYITSYWNESEKAGM